MSRSYRKPYDYFCCGNPSKDKLQGRRRLRRAAKQLLREMEDSEASVFPTRDEVDNPWDWNVDGKQRYVGNADRDDYLEKVVRK